MLMTLPDAATFVMNGGRVVHHSISGVELIHHKALVWRDETKCLGLDDVFEITGHDEIECFLNTGEAEWIKSDQN